MTGKPTSERDPDDMKLDKLDMVLVFLQIISRELFLANADKRKALLDDPIKAKVLDLCLKGESRERLGALSRIDDAKLAAAVEALELSGFLETYSDQTGGARLVATNPRLDSWYVVCRRDHSIVLSHGWPSPNQWEVVTSWGPFNGEPEARRYANTHFPGWRC